jgi:hypothetical protein
MKTQKDIEHMLASTTPTLKRDEAEVLWQRIEKKITQKATPSPFFTMFTLSRMSIAAFALVLILGVGGTTAAAQQSRPGDVLFPIERALEEVRLALAVNDTARASLQLKFAEERLLELRSLVEETQSDATPSATTDASSTVRFSGEADVFSDITFISVEINDTKTSFRTNAQTREDVVEEIARRYNLSQNLVDAGLDFEIENRTSRVSDIVYVKNSDKRIDESMKLLSSLVDDSDDSERKRFVNEVLKTLDIDSYERVEIRDDEDDRRIEIRDDSERIRIREKDGEVLIDIKSNDRDERDEDSRDGTSNDSNIDEDEHADDDRNTEDDDRDNDEEERDDNDNDITINDDEEDSDTSSEEENDTATDESTNSDDENTTTDEQVGTIEVRVEDGEAEVRVSYNGDDDKFTLPYSSRALLISAIAIETGLTEETVEDHIEIEMKD